MGDSAPLVSDSREGAGVGTGLGQRSSCIVGARVIALEKLVGIVETWIVGMDVDATLGPLVLLIVGCSLEGARVGVSVGSEEVSRVG